MDKRKILYVITKSVWGGAQRYVYDLATNLPKDRFETVVVAGRSPSVSEPRPNGAGGQGPLIEKLEVARIRTITLPILQERGGFFKVLFSFMNVRVLFSLIKIFRAERPDVIHLNSSKIGGLGGIAVFLHKLLTLNFKLLTCFTVHGWPFKESRPRWQKDAIFLASWLSSFFHDKIILIDTADFRTAKRFLPQRKCVLIFNGIGEIDFLPREAARSFLARKVGRAIDSNTVFIGTIAELTKNKGLSVLIDALVRFDLTNYGGSTSIVNIIGDGEERGELQNKIKIRGLGEAVLLPGFVPDAHRYLKGLDIFVLPSLKEGLPYTIMEAMAAGLAIAATNVGGIPDLISNGKEGLLVPPRNTEALGAAIKKLIENEPQRNILGVRAREKVEKYFLFETMLAKTIKIYSS